VRCPLGVEVVGGIDTLAPPALLAAMTAAVDRLMNVGRCLAAAHLAQGVPQAGLIALHPDQQGVAGGGGLGELGVSADAASSASPPTPCWRCRR